MFQWPSTVTMSKSPGQNKLGLVAAVRSTNRCSSSLELVSTCHNVSFITMACPFENLVCIHVVFLCGRHNVTQRLEQANFPANSQHIRKVALTLVCSIFFTQKRKLFIHFTVQARFWLGKYIQTHTATATAINQEFSETWHEALHCSDVALMTIISPLFSFNWIWQIRQERTFF